MKPFHIMLPKTKTYVKSCDGQTKWMHFLIEDGNLYKNIYKKLNIYKVKIYKVKYKI